MFLTCTKLLRRSRAGKSYIEEQKVFYVKRINQSGCGDRWLTVRITANQLDMKRINFGSFSLKIWTCRKCAPNWCQDNRMKIRSTACKCARTSSNVFKLNQTCFVDWRKQNKVKIQNHIISVLWGKRYRQKRVLATEPDNQLTSLQGDIAIFASLGAREEMRVVAGQFAAASTRESTCSQRPEHLKVPGREKHCRSGTTPLFPWYCSVWIYFFFLSFRRSSRRPVLKAWKPSKGPYRGIWGDS